jgi:hypothetical protein
MKDPTKLYFYDQWERKDTYLNDVTIRLDFELAYMSDLWGLYIEVTDLVTTQHIEIKSNRRPTAMWI